jgi:peptide/nickel transport system substrate-binding protein
MDTDTPGNIYLMFNVTRGPWAKRAVRQALMHATNFKMILERASFGLGNVPRSPIDTRYKWAFDPNNPKMDLQKTYPYNPKLAGKLLDKAGYPKKADGTRFSIKMIYMTTNPLLAPSAEILRTNWRDVGVNMVLQPVERQVMISHVYKKRDFEATVQAYTTAGDPAIGIHRAYATNKSRRPFVAPTGYSNPEVDDLFNQAAGTTDFAERGKFYRKVAPILVRDLPTVLLLERGEADFVNKKFKGLWKSDKPYTKWDEVWYTGGREKP